VTAPKLGVDDFAAQGGSITQLGATAVPIDLFAALSDGESKRSQASIIVDLANDFELFHSPGQEAFATIPIGHRHETHRLRTKAVKALLAARFYAEQEKAPGAQALQDALNVLEGQALFTGAEHVVYTRVAHLGHTIFLDLADEGWRCVEITAGGWRVLNKAPVKFRRARGMLALPTPLTGGTLEDLRLFFPHLDGEGWTLVAAWLVATLSSGPFPDLVLQGEQGSGKTTLARVLRRVVDPNVADLRPEPRDNRDLIIAATNGYIVALDNMSKVTAELSDALCRLATGGGFGTRELYSDDEEKLFDTMRPAIINGITDVAGRSDLIDRSLIINIPQMTEDQRRPEARLWAEFEAMQPYILGALLGTVACALENRVNVKLGRLPRMADFAIWVVAAEPALGWDDGTFINAYNANRSAANGLALESSPVVPFIRRLVELGSWTGTSTDLLKRLNGLADDRVQRLKSWPKAGNTLSGILRRLAPNLRADGIDVEFPRNHKTKTLTIRLLEEVAETSSPSSPSSTQSNLGTNGCQTVDDGWTMGTIPPLQGTIPTEPFQAQRDDGDDQDDLFATHSKNTNGHVIEVANGLYGDLYTAHRQAVSEKVSALTDVATEMLTCFCGRKDGTVENTPAGPLCAACQERIGRGT